MARTARIGHVRALFTVALMALTVGCTVSGNPEPEHVDLTALDMGRYSSVPLATPVNDAERYGRVLESVRLGEALLDPVEADPALSVLLEGDSVVPLPTPATATVLLSDAVRPVLEREGMVAGVATGARDRDSATGAVRVGGMRQLVAVVLRFGDAEAARRAARDIDAADAAVSAENVAVSIPDHPGAHGHWRPTAPTLAATLAEGSYVISLLVAHTTTDLGALTDLAHKAFNAQLPRLREFLATPPDRLTQLALDRDGMLARMVPEAPRRWTYPAVAMTTTQRIAGWQGGLNPVGIVFGPRATYLSFKRTADGGMVTDAAQSKRDAFALTGTTALIRFTDVKSARSAYARAVRTDAAADVIPGPTGLADAQCTQASDKPPMDTARFTCRVLYGRYIAVLSGAERTNTLQRVAAQYGLLARGD
ncbi:hypothetical protein [Nocardia sp. NPDC056000]|uniref:DUF7373 family lipoprotein n=1 Tax=Nocardia sp. NPDC056000 TaxID=3345674 RepID=UPI0035DDA3F5